MATAYFNNWLLFTIAFTLLLVVTFIMKKQSEHFYTQDVIIRKFSMMELQLPATPRELYNLIEGLFLLPPYESKRSLSALRGQLWLDFLFMPLAYGCIFLLCWRIAGKMDTTGGYIAFMIFAIGQVIPWICDFIENFFLLSQLHRNVKEISANKHRLYLIMEVVKWGFSITALVCALSAVSYFWCTGEYSITSLKYLLIIAGEIIVFLLLIRLSVKKKKAALQQ